MNTLISTMFGLTGIPLGSHQVLPVTAHPMPTPPVGWYCSASEDAGVPILAVDYLRTNLNHKALLWDIWWAETLPPPRQGHPYHIELSPGVWLDWAGPLDQNLDGFVDPVDYNLWLTWWEEGDPRADFNGDGWVDPLDYNGFLNVWEDR